MSELSTASLRPAGRMFSRANDASVHCAEADAVAVALTPAGNRKSVAILEPFARFAARELERICAAPCQLEHATSRILSPPADCAAGEQIARLKIATINRVMGELLHNAPVKVLEICPCDGLRFGHFRGLQS